MRTTLGGGQVGGTTPRLIAPVLGQLAPVGLVTQVVATVPVGSSPNMTFNGHAPVAMTVVGTKATASFTPVGGDAGTAVSVTVAFGAVTLSTTVDVETNLQWWTDYQNPATYTQSGGNVTAIKSLVTGTALNTVTGTPNVGTDPRFNKTVLNLDGSSYIKGVDATYVAAVTGTNKPFTHIVVCDPVLATASLVPGAVADPTHSGNGMVCAQGLAGKWFAELLGNPSGPAHLASSEPVVAGLSIVCWHSTDGLTIKTSVNGGVESSQTITTVGAIAPTTVGVGVQPSLTPTFPFQGVVCEEQHYDVDKTAQLPTILATLLKKWKIPPFVYHIGDSVTTGQNALPVPSNGGMPALLAQAVVAAGGICETGGPLNVGQPFPFRHSAHAGDTPADMLVRVQDATQGLGKGGGSKGYYARSVLACLFACTNPGVNPSGTLADYATLLAAIDTLLLQGDATPRIAVTTITDISTMTGHAYVLAINAGLPTIWGNYNAAHPTRPLLIWDAYNALPNDGSGTYYVDTTHPNNAGYVKMLNDPTYGMFQAVVPYLLTRQP